MFSILIRPLVAFALFFVAAVIGRWILRQLPAGRVKRLLGWHLPVIPANEAERRNWWPVVLLLGSGLLLWAIILYNDPLRH